MQILKYVMLITALPLLFPSLVMSQQGPPGQRRFHYKPREITCSFCKKPLNINELFKLFESCGHIIHITCLHGHQKCPCHESKLNE